VTAPVQLTPGPDSFSITDWTQMLHNAAQVQPDHPRYAESRALIQEALKRIDAHQQQLNAGDVQGARLDPRTSFAMNAAQGMSMGLGSLVGDALSGNNETSNFLSQARGENPKASIAGNVGGAAAPSIILAAMGVPSGIAMGAPAGLQAGIEAKSPTVGAITGGATAIAGPLLGKALRLTGIPQLLGRGVGALAAKFASGAAETGARIADEELIGNMSAGALRRQLAKQGLTPDQVERQIAQAHMSLVAQRAAQPIGGPLEDIAQAQADFAAGKLDKAGLDAAMEQAGKQTGMTGAVKADATAAPAKQVPGTMGPIAGTAGRGFEVTGVRATPPVPETPTITEIQDRLAGLGKGKTLPYYPRGGKAEQALAPNPATSTTPEPGAFSDQLTKVHQTLLDLRGRLGRPLTPDERELVLGQLLGTGGPMRAMANTFGSVAPR